VNPCLKTGADVLIESHQAVIHGDLYVCGEMFVLRYLPDHDASKWIHDVHWIYDTDRIENPHARFENSLADEVSNGTPWLPPDNLQLEGAGVWMIHRDYVQLNPELTALLSDQEAYRNFSGGDTCL
jgi:hypothetical protein